MLINTLILEKVSIQHSSSLVTKSTIFCSLNIHYTFFLMKSNKTWQKSFDSYTKGLNIWYNNQTILSYHKTMKIKQSVINQSCIIKTTVVSNFENDPVQKHRFIKKFYYHFLSFIFHRNVIHYTSYIHIVLKYEIKWMMWNTQYVFIAIFSDNV